MVVHSSNPSRTDIYFRFSVLSISHQNRQPHLATSENILPGIFLSWPKELATAGSRCTWGQSGSHTFVPKEQCCHCSGALLNVGTVTGTGSLCQVSRISAHTNTCTAFGSVWPCVCTLTSQNWFTHLFYCSHTFLNIW